MFDFNYPITEIIQQRHTCRTYEKTPIAPERVKKLEAFMELNKTGPLGTPCRFELVAAMEQDSQALRGLGTYGLIKNPAGFIIGAMERGKKNLEDFGYGMETIILYATSLGLGTCWLGGNFTKSSFFKKIRATGNEIVPAVASVGYPAEGSRARDKLRQKVKSDTRRPWNTLFFQSGFSTPLSEKSAGIYAQALEMVRLSPSGHNFQPWRIILDDVCFHFYLQRTPGYGPVSPMFKLLGVADLPRIEIGIAMSHFELTARELGLDGEWAIQKPALQMPVTNIEYIVTWIDRQMAG